MISTKYNIWNGATNVTGASVAQSTWSNVVFINLSGTASTIYIDGALDRRFSTSNSISAGSAQLMAILSTLRNTQAYLGSFMGYNRSLSAAEVLQNYLATKKRYGK